MSKYKKECYVLISIVIVLSFVSYCIFNSSNIENFKEGYAQRPSGIYSRDIIQLNGYYPSTDTYVDGNSAISAIQLHIGHPDNLNLTTNGQSYMILPDQTKIKLISNGYNLYSSIPSYNQPIYQVDIKNLQDIVPPTSHLPKILFTKIVNGIPTNIGTQTRYNTNFNITSQRFLDKDNLNELEKSRIDTGLYNIDLDKHETYVKPSSNFQVFVNAMANWKFIKKIKTDRKTSNPDFIKYIKKNKLEKIKISIQRVFISPIGVDKSSTNISKEIELQILDGDSAFQDIIIPGIVDERMHIMDTEGISPVFSHTLVYYWKYSSSHKSNYMYKDNIFLNGIFSPNYPRNTTTDYYSPMLVKTSDGSSLIITDKNDYRLNIRSLLGSDKIPKLQISGIYNGPHQIIKKGWVDSYPNEPTEIWSSKFTMPNKLNGNRTNSKAWCQINEAGDKIRSISCPQINRKDYNCPAGYAKDGNNKCVKSWTSDCGESCANDLCTGEKGKWIPLDYYKNPYTCQMPDVQVSSDIDCYNPYIERDLSKYKFDDNNAHGIGDWVDIGDISTANYNNSGVVNCELKKINN